jgi:hypothetical protein
MKTIILGNTIETLEDLVEEIDWHVVKPCEDPDCDGEGCPAGIHFRERPVFVDNSSTPYQYESVSEGSGRAIVRFEYEALPNAKYGLVPLLFDLSHPDYYLSVQSVKLERATNDIELTIEWEGDR